MLKKLAQIQLLGLAFIWIYVGFNLYTMEKNSPSIVSAGIENEPLIDTVTDETAAAISAENSVAVKQIPAIKPKVIAPPSGSELIFPVAGFDEKAIISFFGDKRGKTRRHKGIDIKAPRHTPIVAVTGGKVVEVSNRGSAGKAIYLRATDGRLYFYAHLEDWSVEENATVEAGQEIGTVGDSGNAKGTTPHLHFEIMEGKEKRALDPLPLLSSNAL